VSGIDTGVTPVANVRRHFRIALIGANQAFDGVTRARFWIDGVDKGSVTTNVPINQLLAPAFGAYTPATGQPQESFDLGVVNYGQNTWAGDELI
jgi:hypothetical protein